MGKYSNVKPEQAEVLEKLERLTGKKLKHHKKGVRWDAAGYTANKDEILQLNLNSMGIKKLPTDLGKLESLQTLFLNNNNFNTLLFE